MLGVSAASRMRVGDGRVSCTKPRVGIGEKGQGRGGQSMNFGAEGVSTGQWKGLWTASERTKRLFLLS